MLTVATMQTRVGQRIQKTDAAYATKILAWLNARYDDLLMRRSWPQTILHTTLPVVAGDSTAICPKDVRHILDLYDTVNNIHLKEIDISLVGRLHSGNVDVQGTTDVYARMEDTVAAQTSSSSVLAIVSASASDVSQTVRVWGISSSEVVTEEVTLTGTTPVNTANAYTRIDRIAKSDVTLGTITLTSNSGGVTVAKIAPTEVSPRYPKIRLIQPVQSALSYEMTYKVKTPELRYAQDTPILPCGNILVIGAYAEALEEQRQFQKATAEWQKYDVGIDRLWAEYETLTNRVPQAVPRISRSDLDTPR